VSEASLPALRATAKADALRSAIFGGRPILASLARNATLPTPFPGFEDACRHRPWMGLLPDEATQICGGSFSRIDAMEARRQDAEEDIPLSAAHRWEGVT